MCTEMYGKLQYTYVHRGIPEATVYVCALKYTRSYSIQTCTEVHGKLQYTNVH
jgi:hypothetical protein